MQIKMGGSCDLPILLGLLPVLFLRTIVIILFIFQFFVQNFGGFEFAYIFCDVLFHCIFVDGKFDIISGSEVEKVADNILLMEEQVVVGEFNKTEPVLYAQYLTGEYFVQFFC